MFAAYRRLGACLVSWCALAICLLAPSVQAATQDITGRFAITRSAVFLNRVTNTYDSTTTLRNTSSAPILGPIDVAVSALPTSVTLTNAAGQTRDAKPFVTPLAAGAVLPPGASVTFTLKFGNPQRLSFPSVLQVLYTVATPPGAPSLIAAIATGGTNAFLIGRIDGAGTANRDVAVEVSSAPTCVLGTLVAGASVAIPVMAQTDESGYFGVTVPGIEPGDFVAVRTVGGPLSACLVSSRDNDSWPKAFVLDGQQAKITDFIDAPGKARWYKFPVTPGQRVEVKLAGLPADYDLAVFRDIGQAFASQFDPSTAASTDLLKLTAEYAPSLFSPSVFSPSLFSPSLFSPDAFSPSLFSPSLFSPSVFSPSVFSPSLFSPSLFSPSLFSPSLFSPSVFSPSLFSPSVFSPSIFSTTEIAQAFSTAQTRSIVAASITPGNGDELAVVNTWNRTGFFYARVTGRGSAFDTGVPFTLNVTKGVTTCVNVTDTAITTRALKQASGLQTVILTDSSRIALDTALPGPSGATLRDKLAALAARNEVGGVLVDVSADDRVRALRAQAAQNPACPFAKNLVADEIKSIVDSYRANPLRYVLIAGGDDVIPFFRTPDQTGFGNESNYVPPVQSNSPSEASLRLDFVLSQDRYGSTTTISLPWNDFPVPGLAVGRLVESAAEIAGMLDAYTSANAVVSPGTSLVTGYDFLEDAATAVAGELDAGTGATGEALITPNGTSPQDPASWTAEQLRARLFGARHDLIFLAGHFSANSALAADFSTSVLTTELVASPTDFTNAIVFSAGCHSGYNIVDAHAIPGATLELDWGQAFARKKATLIAGTGYQYGDTDFLEYSERLYARLARQLRAGPAGSAVAIGEALVQAKLDYLAATPDIRGLHEKALLEATLFGLPMLGVNMPAGRGATPGTQPAITPTAVAAGPAAELGLRTKDLSVAPQLAAHEASLKNLSTGASVTAKWLSGPDGVVNKPGEPALPLAVVNVTPVDSALVLRGIGYRGGTYVDSAPLLPFTGAPTTETRGVHVPFLSAVNYPATMWTPNYFGALAGSGGTQLLVTPVQHRAASVADGTSTQRRHTDIDLRLYYSANLSKAALSDAPIIVAVDAQQDAAGGIGFAVQVVGDPAAAIYQVWVTYTGTGINAWTSLDLEQCVRDASTNVLPAACGTTEDSRLWMARLASPPAGLKYLVQAVNGVGLVTRNDNAGAYFGRAAATPAATAIALVAPPASATIGDSVTVTARLGYASGVALVGKTVSIAAGGTAQLGTTANDGTVTVKIPVAATAGAYQITAAFAGDDALQPSSATSPITFVRAPATPTPVSAGVAAAGINLASALNGTATAPQQVSVAFTVDGPAGTTTIYAITDVLGNATLPPPSGLPAGTYTVTQASFGGDGTFAPTTIALSQQFTVPKSVQGLTFDALPDKALGSPDFAVFASASSGLAVTFGASGACTVAGSTVHLTGAGNCTITADQAGNANYEPAPQVARTFAIASVPTVLSLVRGVPSPTMADSVAYTLTLNEAVSGVTASNFAVTTTGITAASLASVAGSGASWTVTVNTGRSSGTLRLDMVNGAGVVNGGGTPLSGTPFQGESFDVDKGGTIVTGAAGEGQPVSSFGTNGYALFADVPDVSAGAAMAVLPDGRLLAASGTGCAPLNPNEPLSPDYCTVQLGRYLADGTPDASFGTNGRITTSLTNVATELSGLSLNDDGTFLIAGIRFNGTNDVPFVARFTGAGAPDTSFGTSGVAMLNSLPIAHPILGHAIDAAGRIVVVSTTLASGAEGEDIFVTRLTSAGATDTTFGTNGVAQFALSSVGNHSDRGTTLAIQPDGKIVVGGRTLGAQDFDFLVMRLDAGGVRDPSFGTNGVATTRFAGTSEGNYGRKLVLQPDGKIVLAGVLVAGTEFTCGVARFNANGTLDAGFGSGGQVVDPRFNGGCYNIALQPDGKTVVGGSVRNAGLNVGALLRLTLAGVPDAGFGDNGLLGITNYGTPPPVAVASSGDLLTMLSVQDPADGVIKSYVVELSSTLGAPWAGQSITFDALPDLSFGAPAFAVSATASSGLPVTFDAAGACSVAGTLVQIGGVGSCTITASQPGNATYLAATSVPRTFSIAPASQSITFGTAPAGVTTADSLITVAATSTSATAAPSANPIVFSSLTPTICSVGGINAALVAPIAVGTCTIAANQAGTANYDPPSQATLSFAIGAPSTTPQTFTVTNLDDSGAGSLRSAIAQANANPGHDFVDFALGLTGTIVLSGQIQISGPLTISGPGADVLTIDGNGVANATPWSRVFSIYATDPACPASDGPDYVVSISGLRLTNGRNKNPDSVGGAIYSSHSLVLDSVIIDNSAARSAGGLGFSVQYPGQTLLVTNSQFLNNRAMELVAPVNSINASGGAFFVFERCPATPDLPYTQPVSVSFIDTDFIGNANQPVTLGGRGGALRSFSLADIVLFNTVVVDNHVDAPNPPAPGRTYHGGAFDGTAKSLLIEDSEISGNNANDATPGDTTRSGALHLFKDAIDGQAPGDAMGVRIVNSTISGNTSSATAGAMVVFANVALELDNSTVAANAAAPTRTGGIAMSLGATSPPSASNTARPTLRLVSSIVANNSGSDVAAGTNLFGSFAISASNSLIRTLCPPTNCTFHILGSGNVIGTDPLLGPLTDNGGRSRTHALLPGSPAINAGSNPVGLSTDQRGSGFPRTSGAATDMGAFESPP